MTSHASTITDADLDPSSSVDWYSAVESALSELIAFRRGDAAEAQTPSIGADPLQQLMTLMQSDNPADEAEFTARLTQFVETDHEGADFIAERMESESNLSDSEGFPEDVVQPLFSAPSGSNDTITVPFSALAIAEETHTLERDSP